MSINEIVETVEHFNSVTFKLFSLTYIIEKTKDDIYVIYSTSMPNSKRYYRTIDELLTKYRIFGDSITASEDRIRKAE